MAIAELHLMPTVQDPWTYWVEDRIVPLEGERIRLTYRTGGQQVGVVGIRYYGENRDVQIDGHGGSIYPEGIVKLEVMGENGRYA